METWQKVERMVGNPDYAVVFSVWPWPDGGWMAGVALLDKEWAEEQGLPETILELEEDNDPSWNVCDGFQNGINVHATSPQKAIEALHAKIIPK